MSGFYATSVGKKVAMAVTGFIVFGFVLVHMLGNLQIFLGPEKLNAYAALLKSVPAFLWAFRLVLVASAILHVVFATQVTLQSWAARPQGYAVRRFRETTYAARTMVWGGPIIGLFVAYHLLHLTVGSAHPAFDAKDVYANVVRAFSDPLIAGIYIAAVSAVGVHLYHGLWSLLQTLGVASPQWNPWRRVFAVVFAVVVTTGMLSVPVAVLCGCVGPV